ncbi:hypothetical protein Tco_1243064 [Tanacetum coccineum]
MDRRRAATDLFLNLIFFLDTYDRTLVPVLLLFFCHHLFQCPPCYYAAASGVVVAYAVKNNTLSFRPRVSPTNSFMCPLKFKGWLLGIRVVACSNTFVNHGLEFGVGPDVSGMVSVTGVGVASGLKLVLLEHLEGLNIHDHKSINGLRHDTALDIPGGLRCTGGQSQREWAGSYILPLSASTPIITPRLDRVVCGSPPGLSLHRRIRLGNVIIGCGVRCYLASLGQAVDLFFWPGRMVRSLRHRICSLGDGGTSGQFGLCLETICDVVLRKSEQRKEQFFVDFSLDKELCVTSLATHCNGNCDDEQEALKLILAMMKS